MLYVVGEDIILPCGYKVIFTSKWGVEDVGPYKYITPYVVWEGFSLPILCKCYFVAVLNVWEEQAPPLPMYDIFHP